MTWHIEARHCPEMKVTHIRFVEVYSTPYAFFLCEHDEAKFTLPPPQEDVVRELVLEAVKGAKEHPHKLVKLSPNDEDFQ